MELFLCNIGAARAARTGKPFITNIVVVPKEEQKPKEELKSLKDIWRSMDTLGEVSHMINIYSIL
jgi:hypothetical protein